MVVCVAGQPTYFDCEQEMGCEVPCPSENGKGNGTVGACGEGVVTCDNGAVGDKREFQ